MKTMAKLAIGTVMACGMAIAAAAPAEAGVRVGIGIGLPFGPAYVGYGAPCYNYYSPYRCGYGPGYARGYVGGVGFYGRGFYGRPGWGRVGWGHEGWGHGGWGHGHGFGPGDGMCLHRCREHRHPEKWS